MSSGYIAEVAKKGFGEGTNELYDKVRPSYQAPVIAYIRDCIRTSDPFIIVEIGSGTGIFTRAMLSHPSFANSVKEVKAVEPSEGMRNFFIKSTVETDLKNRVSVREGTFDNTGVEGGVMDMIVMAQAFHWCADGIHEATAQEFARILKPGGICVMLWNRVDSICPAWLSQVNEVVDTYKTPDQMSSRTEQWRNFFNTPIYSQLFEPPTIKEEWPSVLPVTKEVVIQRTMSASMLAVQTDQTKRQVKAKLDEILERGEDMKWIDEGNGVFESPYKTLVAVARKKGVESL